MKKEEFLSIIAAIITLAAIIGFEPALKNNWSFVLKGSIFSIAFIFIVVYSKKLMASMLDADVEHETWKITRYGFLPSWYFEKPVPAGIILPLFFSFFSLGLFIIPTLLTYEATALKRRAAKRFGFYSQVAMTDWHMGLIGAAGIISSLIVATILYFANANLESLAGVAILYTLFNMIPLSKLDGAQIFYGSRLLWTTLAIIIAVFVLYALLITMSII